MPLATAPGGAAAPAARRPLTRRGTTTTQVSGAMVALARATIAMAAMAAMQPTAAMQPSVAIAATVAMAAVARTPVSGQAGRQKPGTLATRTARRPARGADRASPASAGLAAHAQVAHGRTARRRTAHRQRRANPGRRCSPGGRGMRRSEVRSGGRGRAATGLPRVALAGAADSARRRMTCGAGSGSGVLARVADGPKLAGPGPSKPELSAQRAGPAVCDHALAAVAPATTATTATAY